LEQYHAPLIALDAESAIQITRAAASDRFHYTHFVLIRGREAEAISGLVAALRPDCELCFVLYSAMDQYRYVRYRHDRFEIRRAGHGSIGPWQDATQKEAEQWLMDVADRNCEAVPSLPAPYFRTPMATSTERASR